MSFIQSLFLFGALAAAVPVLIHLNKSRNYQRVRVGTLRFLSSVVQERRRFRKIENWPLLLCRIALLVLLALLFARPFWPEADPSSPQGAETLVLVDSSGSLAHPQAAAQIKKIIATIEKDLPPESPLTLAEFADGVQLTESPKAVAGAPTNFSVAVDWTIERLAQSESPPAAIHFITDLQKDQLPNTPPRLWPTGVETEIHRVFQERDFNFAIEDVQLNTPFREEVVEIEAPFKVYGAPSEKEKWPRLVILKLNDGTQLKADFPRAGGRVRFRWKAGESNDLRGSISFGGKDPWPKDNVRHFAFQLQERKKVLLVDGDPGATSFLGEAYFLDKALQASGATHGQSPFISEISYGLTTRNGLVDLAQYELIVLCNVASLTAGEAEMIQMANAQGAGLLFVLGDRMGEGTFRSFQSSGLFPSLTKSADPRMDVVSWWQSEESQAPALASLPPLGLRSLLLRNAFEFPESEDWNPWARFSNKNPLLLEKSNLAPNQAPVIVLAHPVTREWGDFPLNSLFVPLMRELSTHLSNYQRTEDVIVARAPGLKMRQAPGLVVGEDGQQTLLNADATEMNPAAASVAQFRSSLGIAENELPQNQVPPAGLAVKAEQAHELWPWILLALLLLLILENFLADRRPRVVDETNPNAATSSPTPKAT